MIVASITVSMASALNKMPSRKTMFHTVKKSTVKRKIEDAVVSSSDSTKAPYMYKIMSSNGSKGGQKGLGKGKGLNTSTKSPNGKGNKGSTKSPNSKGKKKKKSTKSPNKHCKKGKGCSTKAPKGSKKDDVILAGDGVGLPSLDTSNASSLISSHASLFAWCSSIVGTVSIFVFM